MNECKHMWCGEMKKTAGLVANNCYKTITMVKHLRGNREPQTSPALVGGTTGKKTQKGGRVCSAIPARLREPMKRQQARVRGGTPEESSRPESTRGKQESQRKGRETQGQTERPTHRHTGTHRHRHTGTQAQTQTHTKLEVHH